MGSATGGPNDLIGREIAGYRLERVLGRGASGAVFLARRVAADAAGPDPVAIKILLLSWELDDEERNEFRSRVLREAQTLRRLQHPNILAVLDVGEQDGLTYMVLPYLGDDTLAKLVARRGPLPFAEVSRYATQLASALDYAHGMGIVHRDIKPQNILLDAEGSAHLADFGIARLLEETRTRTKLTNTSRVMGTPDYMAPEQMGTARVSAAADIYGLGVVIFELVTGRVPFEANSLPELIRKQIEDAPPNPQQLRPDLPDPAAAVILKALAKLPQDRFASAGDFAQAFALGLQGFWPAGLTPAILAGQPTEYGTLNHPSTIAVSSPIPTMPPALPRHGNPTALIAIVSLTLVVGVLGALLFSSGHGTPAEQGAGVVATATPTLAPTATPTLAPTATPTLAPTATPRPTSTPIPLMAPTLNGPPTNSVFAATFNGGACNGGSGLIAGVDFYWSTAAPNSDLEFVSGPCGPDTIRLNHVGYAYGCNIGTWSWRVRSVDDAGNTSPWSSTWTFTVVAPPTPTPTP